MLCCRCVLPLLALYMSLEEIPAAALPSSSRNKREVSWPEEELFPHLHDPSDQMDLSVGDAGDMGRGVETFVVPTEHLNIQHQNQNQNQNQFQYQRKANEKRRKVAPLDSIGRFQMSSSRNRQDEPDAQWEVFSE